VLRRPAPVHVLTVFVALFGLLVVAVPAADAAPRAPKSPTAGSAAVPRADAVPRLDLPENGSVNVDSGPSLAAHPFDAASVGPGTLSPSVPAGSALLDQVSAQSLARLRELGLTTGGKADPSTTKLLPATKGAPLLDVPGPLATLLEQISAQLKTLTGIDLLQLLGQLPQGIPLLTYRLCARSAGRATSCSLPHPLIVPAVVDVTGDGTPDILADAIPAVDLGSVLDLARQLVSALTSLANVQDELSGTNKLAGGPHPILVKPLVKPNKLSLQPLLTQLTAKVQQLVKSLNLKLGLGIGLLSARLPTSETTGHALKAEVWAEYDLPTGLDLRKTERLSMGFDGYQRGAGLSGLDFGIFTADLFSALNGKVDAKGRLFHLAPAASEATVLGLAAVNSGDQSDPTVVSARQTPVPGSFTVHAVIDPAQRTTRAELTSSRPTTVDAVAVTDSTTASPPEDRVTHIVIDQMPATATAELTRAADGEAKVAYSASGSIGTAAFHDDVYRSGTLQKTMGATATAVPNRLDVDVLPGIPGRDTKAVVAYTASAAAARTLTAQYADLAASRTIVNASLTGLPRTMTFAADYGSHHLTLDTSSPVGSISVLYQRAGGAIAVPGGDHATYLSDGAAQGVSARLSGLSSFDITTEAPIHAHLVLDPGGRPFLFWAGIDRTHLARVDVSNLPGTIDVVVDPAARTTTYQASSVIRSLRAAYANRRSGPTLDATVEKVPSTVTVAYRLGATPQVKLTTSSSASKAIAFYSPDYVTRTDPGHGTDVSATITGVPKQITVDLDLAAQHFEWNSSAQVTSAFAAIRVPYKGRRWSAAAKVTGVPTRFTADYNGTDYHFQGVSGPVGSAEIAATNHPGATAPSGAHLAAHYRQSTGDLDASVRVDGLSDVRYATTAAGGFTTHFASGGSRIAVDADVRLAPAGGGSDDVRYGLRGFLGPVPKDISFTSKNGAYTYSASAPLDVRAQFWLGKVKALAATGAPRLANGISAVDNGCARGAGCVSDKGPFCLQRKGAAAQCFGATGIIDVTGLPSSLVIDPPDRTYSFDGYTPRSHSLRLYLHDRVYAASFAKNLKALATLTGLPRTLDKLTVGPFTLKKDPGDGGGGNGGGNGGGCGSGSGSGSGNKKSPTGVLTATYAADAPDRLGSLRVQAEGDLPGFGDTRALAIADAVPGSFKLKAQYGETTHIEVTDSAPIDTLEADLTAPYDKNNEQTVDASANARLTGIPAHFEIDLRPSGTTFAAPLFTYNGHGASTLSGSLVVDSDLIRKTTPCLPVTVAAALSFTHLGSRTSAAFNDSNKAVELTSSPQTDELKLDASLTLKAVQAKTFTRAGSGYSVDLHIGLKDSYVNVIGVDVHALRKLDISPGYIPGASGSSWLYLGYLFPGFQGDFQDVHIALTDFRINVDAAVHAKALGHSFDYTMPPIRAGLTFHRYAGRCGTLFTFRDPLGNVHPLLHSTPSQVAQHDGGITIPGGTPAPQTITFLDPDGKVPPSVLQAMAVLFWRYPGTNVGPGGC